MLLVQKITILVQCYFQLVGNFYGYVCFNDVNPTLNEVVIFFLTKSI